MYKDDFDIWKEQFEYELIDNYRQYLSDIVKSNEEEFDIRKTEGFDDWAMEEFKKYSED